MGGINHQTCDGLWHCFTHISQVNIPFIHQLRNSTSWCPSWSKTLMWVKHIGLLVYQPFLYKSPFWMEREIFGLNGGFSGKNHRKKHRIFQPATFDTGGYNPLMGYIYIYIVSLHWLPVISDFDPMQMQSKPRPGWVFTRGLSGDWKGREIAKRSPWSMWNWWDGDFKSFTEWVI